MNLSCRVGQKSNPKIVGYPHNCHGALAPVGTYYLASWYCNMQYSQMVKTTPFLSEEAI